MRDLFVVSDAVFDVQSNGIFYILYGFLVRVALAVAALECGARNCPKPRQTGIVLMVLRG